MQDLNEYIRSTLPDATILTSWDSSVFGNFRYKGQRYCLYDNDLAGATSYPNRYELVATDSAGNEPQGDGATPGGIDPVALLKTLL